MDKEQLARVMKVLNDAEKWVDDNDVFEFEEDPQSEIIYDGFVYMLDIIKAKKGMK